MRGLVAKSLSVAMGKFRHQKGVTATSGLDAAMNFIIESAKKKKVSNTDEFSENNPDRLKVLVDPDAAKLVQKLYQQYVSEDDYSTLVMFIKDFDSFLAKYRDRPLTKREIEKIEKEQRQGEDAEDEDHGEQVELEGDTPEDMEEDGEEYIDDDDEEITDEDETDVVEDDDEEIPPEEPSVVVSRVRVAMDNGGIKPVRNATRAAAKVAAFLGKHSNTK